MYLTALLVKNTPPPPKKKKKGGGEEEGGVSEMVPFNKEILSSAK